MDTIEVMNSYKQVIKSKYVNLGLDTEFLVYSGESILWPDDMHLPQERKKTADTCDPALPSFDIHGDGFATELCIVPGRCIEERMKAVADGLKFIGKRFKAIAFQAPSVYTIPNEIVEKSSDDAKRLGCSPSLNVYGDSGKPSTLGEDTRTTGCHLHLSYPGINEAIAETLVKWSDILVGCTWTFISPEPPEVEKQRRKAYGRAGEYRLQKYLTYPHSPVSSEYFSGVEYRVLPGTVLHHPVYFSLMFNLYRHALSYALDDRPNEDLSVLAREAVNNADKDVAKQVLDKLNLSNGTEKLLAALHRRKLDATQISVWHSLAVQRYGHQSMRVEND